MWVGDETYRNQKHKNTFKELKTIYIKGHTMKNTKKNKSPDLELDNNTPITRVPAELMQDVKVIQKDFKCDFAKAKKFNQYVAVALFYQNKSLYKELLSKALTS